MEKTYPHGAFLLKTAAVGQSVSVAISYFTTCSVHLRDLALKISLSTALLTEAGNQVNANPFFTPAFQTKFEPVILKCKKDYEIILAAIEKAAAHKGGEELAEGEIKVPKKPWKKFLWAMDMDEDAFEDFETAFGVSLTGVRMVQIVVQLVILQVNAKDRDLLPSELTLLTKLKRNMGDLLEMLRSCDVTSVVAFSLIEPGVAANAAQISKEGVKELLFDNDDSSSITASVSTYVPSLKQENSTCKNCSKETPVVKLPLKESGHFEMYRASISTSTKSSKQTTFSILRMPITINKTETDSVTYFDKVPATQEEISVFMAATENCILIRNMEIPRTSAPTIDDCTALPPLTCHQIYKHLNDKNRTEYMYVWSIERVVQMEPIPLPSSKPRFWRKEKTEKRANDKFMVILRRDYRPGFGAPPPPPPPAWNTRRPRGGPPPPPPPGWPRGPPGGPPGGPPVIVNLSKPKKTTKTQNRRYRSRSRSSSISTRYGDRKRLTTIELTQEESEKVVNDFLATFSTVYEGVGVEERGKAMREIVLDAEDSEYDSDTSGSSGTRSLVDD